MSPVLWMLLSSFLFSILSALVKHVNYLPSWEIVFFRSSLNFIILLPWVNDFLNSKWKSEIKFLLLRGLAGCFSMFLYFYAIENLKLADAVMLNYSSPIPTLLLSAFFLKERISKGALVFILIALVGIALILKPDMNVSSLAGIAGFSSAFIASIAYISMKVATRNISSKAIVFSFAGISMFVSAIPTFFNFIAPRLGDYPFIFAIGIIATLAQLSMTRAYRGLPASVASPLSLSAVLFAAIFGFVIWKEIPDIFSIIGAVLLTLGLIGAYQIRPKS